MTLEIAQEKHINSILKLHYKYQLDSINEDDKKDGFITTVFTKEEFLEIINNEQAIFIALEDEIVIAYIICASWKYRSKWPMFKFLQNNLSNITYFENKLDTKNSYQHGPVCIDKKYRGSGLLEELFNFSLDSMQKKYSYILTFVNKSNTRSYEAHKRKLGFSDIKEFTYNENTYYQLALETSKK